MTDTIERASGSELEPVGGYDPDVDGDRSNVVDLGEVAAQGIQDSAAQGALIDAPEGQLVRFVGASYKDTDDTQYSLGEERVFTVRGKVVGQGDKIMADGHERHEVVVKVESVTIAE